MLINELGPMTVADYMSHALQHPNHGYYTGQDAQIGREGDFTTAPEISQLFGEAVGEAAALVPERLWPCLWST